MERFDERALPSASLLLTTTGDVNNSGAAGLNSWTDGTGLEFGDPNFSLGPGTTNGAFSRLFAITGNVAIDGLNYVRQSVTIGSGANSFTVQPGDLLLSLDKDNIQLSSLNQIVISKDDVFVYRPKVAGDYSAGTLFPLITNFSSLTGGSDTRAAVLVERDTVVGDVTLPAGSFLFTQDGGGDEHDIRLFVPTAIGTTTAGTVLTLIKGADLNFQPKVLGIELVDVPTDIGGQSLAAGTLIVSLDNDDPSVGTNGIAVTKFDAFTLTVSRTTLASGQAEATAAILFQGSDVGLNTGAETLGTITIRVANSSPVANADDYTVAEDAQLTVASPSGVLANDTDADGDPLTATLKSGPSHGTVDLQPDGAFTYTPDADYFGSDQFTYVVSDGQGGASVGTVKIWVSAVNDPPTLDPVADQTVAEDSGSHLVQLTGISAGGGESQGLALSAFSSDSAIVPDPQIVYYSPAATANLYFHSAANASGTVTITVVVRDSGLDGQFGNADDQISLRRFQVDVTPVNHPPTAAPDAYSELGLLPLNVSAANGVLANDSDVDNDPLVAVLVSGPANGTLTLGNDGSFTYVPNLVYIGADSFTYQARDPSSALSAPTTVLINDGLGIGPPAAGNDAYTTDEDMPLAGPSILANDLSPRGSALTAELVSGTANGSLTLYPDGTFLYVPNANFDGSDSFTYRAFDGLAYSNVATVAISVDPVNDPPVAVDDAASVDEDGSTTIDLVGNDSDVDGDALSIVSVTQGSNGSVAIVGANVVYTPFPDFFGADSFTYTISDGNGGLAVGTVNVTVNPVNDPPTLNPIADQNADEDAGPQTIWLTGIAAGGGESDPLWVTAISSDPSLIPNPTITYSSPAAAGTLTYVPVANASGTVNITVTVSDGVATTSRSFTIIVNPVNDPPTITPIADQTIAEDTSSGPLGFTIDDAETAPEFLTVQVSSSDQSLVTDDTLVLTGTGANRQLTITPAPNASGQVTITLTVSDGEATVSESFLLTITPVNDPPVGVSDEYVVEANAYLAIDAAAGVLANDTDVDGDHLTVFLDRRPVHGTLALSPNGSFRYRPSANFAGVDTFAYRVTDKAAASEPVTVTVIVHPAAAAPDSGGVPMPAPVVPPEGPGNAQPSSGGGNAGAAGQSTTEQMRLASVAEVAIPPAAQVAALTASTSINLGSTDYFAPAVALSNRDFDNALPALRPSNAPLSAAANPTRRDSGFSALALPDAASPAQPVLVPPPRVSTDDPAGANMAATPMAAPIATEALVKGLDELDRQARSANGDPVVGEVMMASGAVASAGYVLLSPRLALWLVGALVARRAAWKPFDPLEIVYAWEDDKRKRKQEAEDDSLQSMVGKQNGST